METDALPPSTAGFNNAGDIGARTETPDVAPAAAPAAPATPPAAEKPADGFGATPLEETGAKFAKTMGPDGAPAAAPAGGRETDDQVRERLGTAIDTALDRVPGNISPEARKAIRDGVFSTADGTAKFLGVPLSALDKVDIGFNANGSVVNGSLSGTVYPQEKQGEWNADIGVSTPNLPGASVSAALSFRVANGLTPEGTPGMSGVVSGKVPGLGDLTFKASTDGTVTVERDLPGLSVGGGVPNAGVEVNIPINETARRLTGTTKQDLTRQAEQITTDSQVKAATDYRTRQAEINTRYDQLLKGTTDPGMRSALDQERGKNLWELQRGQVQTDKLLLDIRRQMLQRIEAR